MHAMVTKYSTRFPDFRPPVASSLLVPIGDVVLVTGTTGTIGCHLLLQLASNPEIQCIYALNRLSKDGKTIRQRQKEALHARGLDATILDSHSLELLEGDLCQPNFGLPIAMYEKASAVYYQCSKVMLKEEIDACFGYTYNPQRYALLTTDPP